MAKVRDSFRRRKKRWPTTTGEKGYIEMPSWILKFRENGARLNRIKLEKEVLSAMQGIQSCGRVQDSRYGVKICKSLENLLYCRLSKDYFKKRMSLERFYALETKI